MDIPTAKQKTGRPRASERTNQPAKPSQAARDCLVGWLARPAGSRWRDGYDTIALAGDSRLVRVLYQQPRIW